MRSKNSKTALKTKAACSAIALAGSILTARAASAEVSLVKTNTWEVYTAGRVNSFVTYTFGDAFPIPTRPGATLVGGGVDTTTDQILKTDPVTGMPDSTQQGTVSKMRIRSGFVPNVLTVGVRRKMGAETTLKAQLSVWGTIETTGQRKYLSITTDFFEGYMEVEGPWGTFTAGRFGSLFSRGITQMEFLYGHGYGVGFSGGQGLLFSGPTAGMIGFGVLASSFSPGMIYTTPSLSGFQIAAGIFDPVQLAGSWEATRTVRPEFEGTYDLTAGLFKTHIFFNGAYQKLYRPGSKDNETAEGVGFGGRFEYGPVHIGAGGHYGKGLGLYYALEGSPADHADAWDPNFKEFRTIDGYSVFGQYALGPLDINLAYGISRVHLLPLDKCTESAAAALMGLYASDTCMALNVKQNESVIKSQTGISAGLVYHVSDALHLDLDYLNARFDWYLGEKQVVNYLNTGVTMTW